MPGRRHLGVDLELAVVGREGPQDLEPARSGHGAGARGHVARAHSSCSSCVSGPLMATGVGEAGEPHQLGAGAFRGEAKLTTFVKVALHGRLHGCRAGVHAALPGHGMATRRADSMSTLA